MAQSFTHTSPIPLLTHLHRNTDSRRCLNLDLFLLKTAALETSASTVDGNAPQRSTVQSVARAMVARLKDACGLPGKCLLLISAAFTTLTPPVLAANPRHSIFGSENDHLSNIASTALLWERKTTPSVGRVPNQFVCFHIRLTTERYV